MKRISTFSEASAMRRSAFTLVELLVVIVVIGILAALLLPLLSGAKARARNATCISQLRQLGIATRLYAEDDNSILPAAERLPSLPLRADKTFPRICDVLAPYVGKAGDTNSGAPVFKCPSDQESFYEVEGSSYMWNSRLNGKRIDFGDNVHVMGIWATNNNVTSTVDTNMAYASESTPLLLDYDDFHPRPPKPGKNVVFMDGHVDLPNLVTTDLSKK